jgi:hypothetical protein
MKKRKSGGKPPHSKYPSALNHALRLSPHISPGEICAASKFFLERNLARPTGKNGKTKMVVLFFRRG